MLYFYSLIYGAVQGLSEFLPVSSSGHLVLLHDILKLDIGDSLAFDVALHLGTLLALLIYFRVEILRYLAAIVEIFIPGRQVNRTDMKDISLLIYASIPAAVVGVVLGETIEKFFRSASVVVITLIFGSILFFVVEKYCRYEHDFSGLSMGRAFYIGLMQTLALIPGVSRSGITIVAGMSAKLKRGEAAKFSFLLSMPVVAGAGVFKLIDIDWEALPSTQLLLFIIGFISSFAVGFLVIKYLLKYLQYHDLRVFAWYRIGLAFLILLWILFK